MAVQIQPAKPKDQHNGLVALEQSLLEDTSMQVTAVVTYRMAKVVEDIKKDETYPVVFVQHIEPITDASALATVQQLQAAAYQVRTGETELDFGGSDEPEETDL